MDEKLNQIKKRELKILKEFKKICDDNGIKYFLAFGTLLGTVRHMGFIPWDDDIDIMMTRKEYVKFLKHSIKLPSSIFFQNESTDTLPFGIFLTAKLRDVNSKVEFNVSHKPGVFIDLFVIDGIPKNKIHGFFRKGKYIAIRYIESLEYDSGFLDRRSLLIKMLLSLLLPVRWLLKKANFSDRLRKGYIKSSMDYNSEYFIYWGKSLCLNKSDIYPTKKKLFEGEIFPVPKNYKKFLRVIYGDYQTLPPIEERFPFHINLDMVEINPSEK